MKPHLANAKYVTVRFPKSRRYEAAYVRLNVPHFRARLDDAPEWMSPPGTHAGSRRGGGDYTQIKEGKQDLLRPQCSEA